MPLGCLFLVVENAKDADVIEQLAGWKHVKVVNGVPASVTVTRNVAWWLRKIPTPIPFPLNCQYMLTLKF